MAKTAVVEDVDVSKLVTYHGSAGTYFVIANKGDNELALNICISSQRPVNPIPGDLVNRVLGLGLRIRFYNNEGGTDNPFTAFQNAKEWGNCTRVKTFVPIVHAGAGMVGLKTLWNNLGYTDKLIDAIKAKVKESGGVMVADDATLRVLINDVFTGIPDKAPYFETFDLDGHGNSVELPYGSESTKKNAVTASEFKGDGE